MEQGFNIKNVGLIEPLRENRFLINLIGSEVPQYLFKKYKIFNIGDDLIFTTEFYETVDFCFNPKEFFNITEIKIDYINPIGDVINSLMFNVVGSNFKINQSYKNDNLQTNKLRFVIDKKTMNLLHKNN